MIDFDVDWLQLEYIVIIISILSLCYLLHPTVSSWFLSPYWDLAVPPFGQFLPKKKRSGSILKYIWT